MPGSMVGSTIFVHMVTSAGDDVEGSAPTGLISSQRASNSEGE
eukprot:CAMPEP_0179193000 /NCGR_PEP_ID=MMETSP0796-20121207/95902_1 /TAXON_ID=73915 /ORGANISM="Pyrodinium bahamense, Strain pbaha01" /LENGTH=42 /DNA_ID= /DNA_START= /DNA_END= /DNA_ORIENTATION=